MAKLTFIEKVQKYYKEHPFFEEYRGWKIRLNHVEDKYLGTLYYYTCDVRVGVESCQATHLDMVHDWIDKKILEGKIQEEDINLIKK